MNLVGVHDSSWEDGPLVEQVLLLQLTIYYVQSITNKFIECLMWYQNRKHACVLGLDMSVMPHLPYTDFVTSSESNQIESYIRNTVDFSDTIQDGYQVCYQCNKFFNLKLMSNKCMLSSEDIVLKFKVNFSMYRHNLMCSCVFTQVL